ncbi:MAG: lipopolysaccharide transport system permease protein [Gaiellaceae bacterium]|jgi:lipopolysaccharide transport system permease protein|nr:lipopolysaccharide transport system permease protein [Gaiellaceae bacterium]
MATQAEHAYVPARPDQPATVRVERSRGRPRLKLHELWAYRELLYFLTWRDVKVRYKQTLLGAAWAILQPVLAMVVFTIFFGHLAKLPSEGLPYALFSFSGLVLWTFFANGLTLSANSLVASSNLITKIYFPRLVIPLGAVLAGAVDFVLALVVLGGLMIAYGVAPGVTILAMPLFLLLAFCTVLAVGLWLSALNVKYRDVRYVVPFLVQLWLFATPIAYPSTLLDEPWRTVYGLNPMVGAIDGFRWSLLGTRSPGWSAVVSACSAVVLLLAGLYYFRRMEKVFADIV